VTDSAADIDWVLLTLGDRDSELGTAVSSVNDGTGNVIVVHNGGDSHDVEGVRNVRLEENVGVPGGRDVGLRSASAPIIGFLDDDAELLGDSTSIRAAFDDDPEVGAVALRLIDEQGRTARRHTPRVGEHGVGRAGDVALFLGGACAVRGAAYDDAGGYFTDLVYGHEEVELCWRLVDRGWRIRYLADVEVFHPRTEISRHADGWRLTGRNRMWIARRSLPLPIAVLHSLFWLGFGVARAPSSDCRRQYLAGWWSGTRGRVERRPIRWATVWRLTRLGRPPII
jgi:GT2 family glycosyltransferase